MYETHSDDSTFVPESEDESLVSSEEEEQKSDPWSTTPEIVKSIRTTSQKSVPSWRPPLPLHFKTNSTMGYCNT